VQTPRFSLLLLSAGFLLTSLLSAGFLPRETSTWRWTLPAGEDLTVANLKLTITDGFGNRKTVRRRVRV